MPVARLIDPQVVIEFLLERGFRTVRETPRIAVLRSQAVEYDIIVPMHGPLSPTVVGDILTNAQVPQDEQDTIL